MRWVLAVVALCGACTESTTLDATEIAQTFCDCITPGATTTCVAQLVPQLAQISAACSTCVEQHETSCSELEAMCEPACEQEPIDGFT
jgi:hypothetical protein